MGRRGRLGSPALLCQRQGGRPGLGHRVGQGGAERELACLDVGEWAASRRAGCTLGTVGGTSRRCTKKATNVWVGSGAPWMQCASGPVDGHVTPVEGALYAVGTPHCAGVGSADRCRDGVGPNPPCGGCRGAEV